MTHLPIIPKPGAPICVADIEQMEARVAREVAQIDDLDVLQEWRSQAAALETYLRGKELNGPMLGAQRRVEARIGQLLGHTHNGQRHDLEPSRAREGCKALSSSDRQRFRLLARALDLPLGEQDWRQPREKLLTLIRERYPVPRHIPTVTTKEGAVKKPLDQRAREVAALAEQGFRRAQIAQKLDIGEKRVADIAQQAQITLPDEAIGRVHKLDAKRILTETVNGVEAYVSGLAMLDELQLPAISAEEKSDLMQALSRSINGLRKLRIRMEREYAGSNATAA